MLEYRELLDDYRQLNDTDIRLAFDLMQRSTAIKDRLATMLVDAHKFETDAKHMAEATKSSLSTKYDVKNSTNGNRLAMCDKEYLNAIEVYTTKRREYELLEKIYDIVNDIRFQTYNIYFNAEKELKR